MIVEALFKALLLPITSLLNLLPTVSAVIPVYGTTFEAIFGDSILTQALDCIFFVFPVKEILPVITFQFAFFTFRFLWAVILRVKSFIPTMGG